jgi:hypothetical protein
MKFGGIILGLTIFVLLPGCSSLDSHSTQKESLRFAESRDIEVIDTVLLKLLADPEFGTSPNTNTIILVDRTPSKIAAPSRAKPKPGHFDYFPDANEELKDLENRNRIPGARNDAHSFSFRNAWFSKEVQILRKNQIAMGLEDFHKSHPDAKVWVEARIPGYSLDGTTAVFTAQLGPSGHGAFLIAYLRRQDSHWTVVWHKIGWAV